MEKEYPFQQMVLEQQTSIHKTNKTINLAQTLGFSQKLT